jgi:hypothetical protein
MDWLGHFVPLAPFSYPQSLAHFPAIFPPPQIPSGAL